MRQIAVIGGGPSGMMAAIAAAREGAAVTILEQKEKPGKKLLMTGNGRCNLTNRSASLEEGYGQQARIFVRECLEQFGAKDTVHFFESLGMKTKNREALVYPLTDQASTVLEILLLELRRWKIKIKCGERVVKLCYNLEEQTKKCEGEEKKKRWTVKTEGWSYQADCVILAAGSKAAPATGSDGSGYQLAENLGLKIKKPLPALVPLKCSGKMTAMLAGLRSSVKLTLWVNGKKVQQEEGELQWTEYGISGIVVFQVSAKAVRALEEKKKVEVELDLLPSMEAGEIAQFLEKTAKNDEKKTVEECLMGVFPKKMVSVLMGEMGWNKGDSAGKHPREEWDKLSRKCKGMRLFITGSKSFEQAQVCSGGVELSEVDGKTLESKRHGGLYLSGEILDIDGICGGYNLQWAWTSGYICGTYAAKGK